MYTLNQIEDGQKKTQSISDKRVKIDTALEATGFGKFNYFVIIICAVIMTQIFLENIAIGFILPVTDCDLNLSTSEKGVISAAGYIGIILSSHLWGFLGDTKGRRRIIQPAIFAAFLSNILSSFTSNFWPLAILRLVNGFFVSAGCSIPLTYLGEFHTDKIRPKAIIAATIIYGLTAFLMPPAAWLVINQSWTLYIPWIDIVYKPWRLFLVITGLPELICGLCLFIIPESPKFTLLQKNQEETLKTLRKIYAMNTGKSGNEYPYSEILPEENSTAWISTAKTHPIFGVFQIMWRQTIPLFQTTLLKRTALLSTIRFLIFITTNGMYIWFTKIINNIGEYQRREPEKRSTICEIMDFNKEHKLNKQIEGNFECKETLEISTYIYNGISELNYFVLFLVISFILKYVGKIKVLFAILFLSGVSGILAAYVNIPYLATAFYLALICSGVSSIVLNIVIVDLFPTSLRAMAGCLTFVIGCLGSVLGTNLLGTLLEIRCEEAFVLAGGCVIISGFLSIFIWRIEKEQLEQQTE